MTQNPSKLDYEKACRFLLSKARSSKGIERPPKHPLGRPLDTLFSSDTKAFREGLVGCVLARLCDPSVDATKPYVKHGDHSYNGRTLMRRLSTQLTNPHLKSTVLIFKGPTSLRDLLFEFIGLREAANYQRISRAFTLP